MTRILATLALIALPTLATAAPRAFVLNQQGRVVGCELARTSSEKAYCAGASIAARDPARFDCATAEVDSEYRFCRKPFPVR